MSTKRHDSSDEEVALSYHYMEKYFRAAVNINAIPYHYDKVKHRFSLDRTSLKYKLWILLMVVGMVMEAIQVTLELIRGSLDDSVSRGEWSLVLFIFISWVFIAGCHLTVYHNGEDIANYINQVLGTREHFKERNLPKTSDHKVVKAHMYISCGQCFFQALMVASEGVKPQYLFSNVPKEYRSPMAWGLWIPYAYYRVMSNFLSGYFQYFVGVFHIQTCNQILMYRQQRKESTEESLKSYRMIQILGKRYNAAFSNTFVPYITIFAAGNIILGNYGTMRFANELEFNLYANFPLMVGMMLLFAFTFYPNNATVKDMSDQEGTRMLFSCLKMEDALEMMMDVARATENQQEIEMVRTPRMVEMVKIPRRTVLTHSEEGEMGLESEKVMRLGGMFQKKMDGMLEKLHKYKMARSLARSCPYVSVRMAGLYPIKRTTVLTIFDVIWSNTISALLTWK